MNAWSPTEIFTASHQSSDENLAPALSIDYALLKLFYMALNNISKKWTMPIRDWKAALNRFSIQFEDRMPSQ